MTVVTAYIFRGESLGETVDSKRMNGLCVRVNRWFLQETYGKLENPETNIKKKIE